jgi:hypothetical protein
MGTLGRPRLRLITTLARHPLDPRGARGPDSRHGDHRDDRPEAPPATDSGARPEKTVEDRIEELRKRKQAARTPGGRDAAKKQHDKGKLTAARAT